MVESDAARARQRDHSIAVTDSSEEEGWLITYLDVITLILVMMVVMLALSGGQTGPEPLPAEPASSSQPAQADVEAEAGLLPGGDGLLDGHSDLLAPSSEPSDAFESAAADAEQPGPAFADMNLSGLGDDIDVIMQERSISFRISSEILFPSGEAWLSQPGYQVLDRLLPVLAEVNHRISVSGHTDNVPIRTEQFPSNWELSSARAGSVVRYLQEQGIDPERLSVIGLGSTRPLQDNDSSEGRAANRRVELTLEMPGG